LALIVQGLPNKEIARRLNLAVGTVKIYVAVLFHQWTNHRRDAQIAEIDAKTRAKCRSGKRSVIATMLKPAIQPLPMP
jgi:DNA-binding NarL/FixJ family response regulator